MMETIPGPLTGIRVLDLGTRVAAPFAAALLADFGAEVIKIELPGTGDFLRSIGPFVDGYSLFYAVENRNKKSVTLDLRQPRGQEIFRRLVATADVVIENFRPGTLEEWGLGWEELREVKPGIILSRASVYGQTGPSIEMASPSAACCTSPDIRSRRPCVRGWWSRITSPVSSAPSRS
jgi:crotonobetainyl-CoA:carnitine CoA-transferase CaiB-like acyl-CoA transferase